MITFYQLFIVLYHMVTLFLRVDYVWDTQSDMGYALLGAVLSLLLLGRYHDRQLLQCGFTGRSGRHPPAPDIPGEE